MYRPLSRFLLRAPLLPVATLPRAGRALLTHPLGADAIAVASPTLAQAQRGAARERAVARYARRAAFRATPSGLLAGVCIGELGTRTDVATGTPVAHLAPSWGRVDALARAWLGDRTIRHKVRLRRSPSLSRAGAEIRWIALCGDGETTRAAEVDAHLGAVLEATEDWTPWPIARARVGSDGRDLDDVDDFLLALVDDELLVSDLAPPVIGSPAAIHLRDRLAAMGCANEARAVDEASARLAAGDLPGGRAAWAALPGASARDVQAVLTHRARRTPRLARAAVARAARLVPLLVRLQEALAPPAGERFTAGALASALDATTEIFGAGAFDLEAFGAGDYGVDLEGDDDAPSSPSPPAALVALLVDAIAGAARSKRLEAVLDIEALEGALVDLAPTPLPATAELFLTPTSHPAGTPPGTGWLLGLHAPAGASMGRFVHALGTPAATACAEIAAAERAARPHEERVDVAFAPTAALADLTAHPPIRARALSLSRWTSAGDDLTVRELLLEADPSAPEALALREARSCETAHPIVPSPFARVRAATAAPGPARLLVGWSLQRQHAPWAFTPGPLAELAFLPRLVLDGFVIAPASWRLPAELRTGRARRGALARWRRAAGLPRMVQVGTGDELYPVDLEAPDAGADLREHERVFEIWPPLDATVDQDGRRVEAVVAVVDDAPAPPPVARLGRLAPPRQAPPLIGWRTFKLFSASARQDALLSETVVPVVSEARSAGEIDAWFFLRYLDGPGERPHLRLRVHAADGELAPFEQRLRASLGPAREAGALASIETGDYFPERGRFADGELAAVHALFHSDSETVAALVADPELDRIAALPLLHDALARGLGLDLAARHTLARSRRSASESWTAVDEETGRAGDLAFRRHGRALRAALIEPAALFKRHEARVAAAGSGLKESSRARLLPTLLHLEAVRLVGPDPDAERIGYTFWERALEGLRKTT